MSYQNIENKRDNERISNEVFNYNLNKDQINTEKVFPSDPYFRSQNHEIKLDNNFIDTSSELLGINRPLTNNPQEKWNPGNYNEQNIHVNLKDGLFNVKNTKLDSPPIELRDQTKNRWIPLFQNPQEHVIEPFKRNGINTYLSLIDNYKC